MAKVNHALRAARVLRGFRQSDLGEKVGRSQPWVSKLELGSISPTDLDVALVCRALKVRPEAVFPDESPRTGTSGFEREASPGTPEERVRLPPDLRAAAVNTRGAPEVRFKRPQYSKSSELRDLTNV